MGGAFNPGDDSDASSLPEKHDQLFSLTDWTLVDAVKRGGAEGERAVEKLCRKYRRPLLCYARAEARQDADAEDLVQGFFAAFLKGRGFSGADREQGRLRNYLLTGLINHRNGEWRREQAQKRGGNRERVSLDEHEPVDAESPDRIYQREWARALLNAALVKFRQWVLDTREDGKAMWRELGSLIFMAEAPMGACSAAAKALGVPDGTVRAILSRWRRKFFEGFLCDEVAVTLENATAEEITAELKEVLRLAGEGPLLED